MRLEVDNKKEATDIKVRSPKIKKTRSKKNKKNIRKKLTIIKILIGLFIVSAIVALWFFAFSQNSVKKDGYDIQKSIENIEKYLEKQKKELPKEPVKKQILPSEPKKQDTNKSVILDQNNTENNEIAIKVVNKNDANDTKDVNLTKLKDQNITEKIDTVEKSNDKKQIKQSVAQNSDIKRQSGKPKLVIIIDDVATNKHAEAIKNINLKITPSIFPPTKSNPNTQDVAKKFSFYMIHLPMQANHFKNAEEGTLKVGDSYEKILLTLERIKKNFPNLKYINNHTGSRFTGNFDSMDRFMKAAKKVGFIFVDSKTTPESKAYKVAKKHDMPYIARDVFLDHENSKESIAKQLKYAVELAKRNSYAIAIGHPYKNTLEVLKNSKELLQDVEVVYLKDIL